LRETAPAQQSCAAGRQARPNVHRSPHGTGDFTYNGIDKIDSGKGYTVNNVVSCCKKCNFAKSNMSQGEFIKWIRKVYLHLKKDAMAQQWGDLLI
jgi:hypothetical protein